MTGAMRAASSGLWNPGHRIRAAGAVPVGIHRGALRKRKNLFLKICETKEMTFRFLLLIQFENLTQNFYWNKFNWNTTKIPYGQICWFNWTLYLCCCPVLRVIAQDLCAVCTVPHCQHTMEADLELEIFSMNSLANIFKVVYWVAGADSLQYSQGKHGSETVDTQ